MCRLRYATTTSIYEGVSRLCKLSWAENKNAVLTGKKVGCLHYGQGCARIVRCARPKEAKSLRIKEERKVPQR